jgi:hypothetical protein
MPAGPVASVAALAQTAHQVDQQVDFPAADLVVPLAVVALDSAARATSASPAAR